MCSSGLTLLAVKDTSVEDDKGTSQRVRDYCCFFSKSRTMRGCLRGNLDVASTKSMHSPCITAIFDVAKTQELGKPPEMEVQVKMMSLHIVLGPTVGASSIGKSNVLWKILLLVR